MQRISKTIHSLLPKTFVPCLRPLCSVFSQPSEGQSSKSLHHRERRTEARELSPGGQTNRPQGLLRARLRVQTDSCLLVEVSPKDPYTKLQATEFAQARAKMPSFLKYSDPLKCQSHTSLYHKSSPVDSACCSSRGPGLVPSTQIRQPTARYSSSSTDNRSLCEPPPHT